RTVVPDAAALGPCARHAVVGDGAAVHGQLAVAVDAATEGAVPRDHGVVADAATDVEAPAAAVVYGGVAVDLDVRRAERPLGCDAAPFLRPAASDGHRAEGRLRSERDEQVTAFLATDGGRVKGSIAQGR